MSKYSVGDKVLVEAEIVAYYSHGMFDILVGPCKSLVGVNEDQIHSLAPEFKQGEWLDVSDSGLNWIQRKFVTKHNELYYVEYRCVPPNTSNDIIPFKYARKPLDDTMIWKDGKRYKLVPVSE